MAQTLNVCIGKCAESRRAQRQLLQAQSRLSEAQETVDAVERSMAMLRAGTPQKPARRTGSRTRSGRVSSNPVHGCFLDLQALIRGNVLSNLTSSWKGCSLCGKNWSLQTFTHRANQL